MQTEYRTIPNTQGTLLMIPGNAADLTLAYVKNSVLSAYEDYKKSIS